MKTRTLLNFALTTFLSIGASQAAYIVYGVTVESSSSSNVGFGRQDFHTVDGSGLTGLAHTNVASGNMWMTSTGGSDLTPSITYDLGSVYNLSSFRVWNYNEFLTDRGLDGVEITYGDTLALGSTLAGVTNFTEATGVSSYTGEVFESDITARYVKIQALSNHGSTDVSGLSEILFTIPEPSSAALLGLGGLALILRRRK